MRSRLEHSGDVVGQRLGDKAMTNYNLYHNVTSKIDNWAEAIFHGKGRNLSRDQINNMGSLLTLEGGAETWQKAAKAMNIELTDDMFNAMEGISGTMEYLGKVFGINKQDWIKNYWTKLGEMDEETLAKILKSNNKSQLNVFFKRLRTQDHTAANLQTNAEHIFKTYVHLGFREKYLGGIIDEINLVTKAAEKDGSMTPENIKLLQHTANQLLGNPFSSDLAENAARRIEINKAHADRIMAGEGRFEKLTPEKRLKKAQIELAKDNNRFMGDLITSSVMAWKPKLPIRNFSQINTVLAPLAGAGNVSRAMKEVLDESAGALKYIDGFDKGIIHPRSGLSYTHGDIQNIVRNINQYGMNNFFNSDDWTRLVAMTAAGNVFDNGQALLKNGDIDLEGFLKACQTDYLGEADKIKFVEMIGNGQLDSARTFMERRWTQMTMFEYEQLNKPLNLNSSFGKVLGQYSTYPLSLIQFMQRGWKAEGAWFASKLMMATTSTAYFYSEILGMDNVINANPIENVMFTGGPVISWGAKTLMNVQRFLNEPSVAGLKNTAKDTSKTFLPLMGIGSKLKDGMEAIREGETFTGLINFTGANANEDALIKNIF